MRWFRRLVIGIAEAVLLLLVLAATVGGGYYGFNAAQSVEFFPQLGTTANAALGLVIGALVGLAGSTISAAFLYAMFEIADNSRATRKQIEYLSGLAYHFVNATLRGAPKR